MHDDSHMLLAGLTEIHVEILSTTKFSTLSDATQLDCDLSF
jgi:hypothetical protein